jgi:hypothetical protein
MLLHFDPTVFGAYGIAITIRLPENELRHEYAILEVRKAGVDERGYAALFRKSEES